MPVLNLEKPGRFKKGGTAMKKPVAKKKMAVWPSRLVKVAQHLPSVKQPVNVLRRSNYTGR
jgi:hypothetical protein